MPHSPTAELPASRVLVTVGTVCSLSAVGSTETHRALVTRSPTAIGFAAYDAGLVDIGGTVASPRFHARSDDGSGAELSLDEIEARWGPALRAEMGIRFIPRSRMAEHVVTNVAAPLPHDLENGGLRELSGLSYDAIRASVFRDMFGLFSDDPRLGPSLQSQLFMYGGLGALAALPRPLSELLPEAYRFRVAAGCAFTGHESFEALSLGMQPGHERVPDKKNDKLAMRLSAFLNTHGPAMIHCMLSPIYNLSKVRKNPDLARHLLLPGTPLRNVPQAPLVVSAACASALVALAGVAPHMVLGSYPGHPAPAVTLLTAADAAAQPDFRMLEAFGLGAMMSREKLDTMNSGRPPDAIRHVSNSLAPFDVDAQGTVVGHAGSGLLITTLQFAVQNGLDITGIIAGWGQSGETGGKGHFAGVGFGGENASILALEMARKGHGYGVGDFQHLVAHATGTRTNSRTDLTNVHQARAAVAEAEGRKERLPTMTVGAPKAVGDGHSMGETGLKAIGEALHYVMGDVSVGIPTLRRIDDQLGPAAEFFHLAADPVPGDGDGGALTSTQGFGGYDGAVAIRAAHADALRRYAFSDPRQLDAYLEGWADLRRERIEREASHRRTRGFVRKLAEMHRWPGPAG